MRLSTRRSVLRQAERIYTSLDGSILGNEKSFLYTIVLKNKKTGKGIPAAFMVMPSEAQ